MARSPPQEICDAVVDRAAEGWGALPTLCACALASRLMTARAQRHIFRTIRFDLGHARLSALAAILAENSVLASHMREMVLVVDGECLTPSSSLLCIRNVLDAVAPHADVLHVMFPRRVLSDAPSHDGFGICTLDTAPFARLAELHLSSCTFDGHAAHIALLHALPTVRMLSIGAHVVCLRCRSSSQPTRAHKQESFMLETIEVNSAAVNCVCIIGCLPPGSLRHLAITTRGGGNINSHFMHRVMTVLKPTGELDIAFGSSSLSSPTPARLLPATGPIRRKGRVGEGARSSAKIVDLVLAVLESLPMKSVGTLRVRLPGSACVDTVGGDWTRLGAWFGCHPAPICRVVFALEDVSTADRAKFAANLLVGQVDGVVKFVVG
jgi:hypothetical protein